MFYLSFKDFEKMFSPSKFTLENLKSIKKVAWISLWLLICCSHGLRTELPLFFFFATFAFSLLTHTYDHIHAHTLMHAYTDVFLC